MSDKLDFKAVEDEETSKIFGDQAEILGEVIVKCLNKLEDDFPTEAAGTDPVQWGISILMHVTQHIVMRATLLDIDTDVTPEEMVAKLLQYMEQDLEQGMPDYQEVYRKKMALRRLREDVIEKILADLPTSVPN